MDALAPSEGGASLDSDTIDELRRWGKVTTVGTVRAFATNTTDHTTHTNCGHFTNDVQLTTIATCLSGGDVNENGALLLYQTLRDKREAAFIDKSAKTRHVAAWSVTRTMAGGGTRILSVEVDMTDEPSKQLLPGYQWAAARLFALPGTFHDSAAPEKGVQKVMCGRAWCGVA